MGWIFFVFGLRTIENDVAAVISSLVPAGSFRCPPDRGKQNAPFSVQRRAIFPAKRAALSHADDRLRADGCSCSRTIGLRIFRCPPRLHYLCRAVDSDGSDEAIAPAV